MATPAPSYTLTTLASGTKSAIDPKSLQIAGLRRKEAALPEQTPVQLDLMFGDLTLPAVGQVTVTLPVVGTKVSIPVPTTRKANPAPYVAQAVNAAYQAGHFVIGKEPLALWTGDTQPASHGAGATTIRWVKGQPWDGFILPVALAVGIAGFVVWQVLTGWKFSKAAVKQGGNVIQGAGDLGKVLLIGAVVVGGIVVVREIERL